MESFIGWPWYVVLISMPVRSCVLTMNFSIHKLKASDEGLSAYLLKCDKTAILKRGPPRFNKKFLIFQHIVFLFVLFFLKNISFFSSPWSVCLSVGIFLSLASLVFNKESYFYPRKWNWNSLTFYTTKTINLSKYCLSICNKYECDYFIYFQSPVDWFSRIGRLLL